MAGTENMELEISGKVDGSVQSRVSTSFILIEEKDAEIIEDCTNDFMEEEGADRIPETSLLAIDNSKIEQSSLLPEFYLDSNPAGGVVCRQHGCSPRSPVAANNETSPNNSDLEDLQVPPISKLSILLQRAQCSNSTCRVAYHPLCARAAGLCVELEDEDRLHLISMDDDDDDDQCIRLLSFCRKHRQPSNERSPTDEQTMPVARHCSNYIPPSNPSGCARSEPYDFLGRRGRKEPEALAAASLKRLFVENRPYLVSGYCQNGSLGNAPSTSELLASRSSSSLQKLKTSQVETPKIILSMAEKYKYMRETVRKRLAFGKSGIHGFGIFAKRQHRAGDMVIEYTGELVRPSIADRREHFIYNSLVPNCYSRVISVNGDEHIIIFAKRDIKRWEELTYDYRFFSIGEQLACYCGFPRCRGVVNDIEAEEQMAKLCVPQSELIIWRGE
ncbi:hypothetical protein HHK36_013206 [Tetracentron sinense]|uniref:Uncharacterized protein n=1 Tax=Tetracentron sinense TaxID=13715 RepID=A0A834Z7B6_TETSI|nr:hypothetical protein HHK36_013206 [Tetracentron sinense]